MHHSGGRRLALTLLALALPALFLMALPAGANEPGSMTVVAEAQQGPGNLTVVADGTVVMSLHPFFSPEVRVVSVGEDGELKPFPNETWATGTPDRLSLDAVLGIQADPRGSTVWMLDNGLRNQITPKLVAATWPPTSGEAAVVDADVQRVIHLPPPVTRSDSFVNDLALSRHDTIYIADPAGGSNAALIVVDVTTGIARRVLEGHGSVVPEDVDLVIDGEPVEVLSSEGKKVKPRVGVNPIALDKEEDWLYYGPMHGTSLYRVRTEDLRNRALSPSELAAKVERYAEKPICDGISIDDEGNVYITDIGSHAIGVIGADRKYRILVQDAKRLQWPDAIAFGPDGKLYTVSNQLHKTARLNAGVMTAKPPYFILRIEPLAPGTPGR